MRKGIFIVIIFSLKISGVAQIPESIKSGCLSYIRLPELGGSNNPNVRFFYKMTIGCNTTPIFNDLFISDPYSTYTPTSSTEISWQFDSSKNVTGVIDPCLVFQQAPCHTTFYYHADAILPLNNNGYIAATLNCCRPIDAANLAYQFNVSSETLNPICECVGTVYNGIASYIKIPPLSVINSSPQITSNDTILSICKGRHFSYQIHASEPDGDSISYHFSAPKSFTVFTYNKHYYARETLPFPAIDFKPGFSASQPAGSSVSMNQLNGVIEGFINDTGTYVITVSALEYRNGLLLDSTMQDLFVEVFDCSLLPKPKASIPSVINNCNSFTLQFPNNSTPLYPVNWNNTTFQWNFGDGDTSHEVYPVHSYADTGTYKTSLIIFPGLWCADTSYTKTIVYPYLTPDFTYSDSCSNQLVLFTNTSVSTGGIINYTNWVIKKDTTLLDSTIQYNTSYSFTKAPQTYTVFLTVGTDKGCMATDTGYINIWQSPYQLASHDTILSRGASLQLQANDGNYNNGGDFYWSPSDGLSNTSIANPVLTSTTDNTYFLSIKNAHGCSLTDSIKVKYYIGPDIYVPNAFTPNGDGKNDIFRPITVGISLFKYFRVFNRYGQLMFETTKPFEGWNGYQNGKIASSGTYVWEVAGIDYNKKLIIKSGTSVLIK